jgi:hypothetical protein
MKRIILILVMLLTLTLFGHSKSVVQLGSDQGNSLFRDLTNNSTNASLNFARGSNTGTNFSQSIATIELGGSEGTTLFDNLTDNSSDMYNNTTGNLSTWGSKPRVSPPPPTYDPKLAQKIEILRQNHLGY